jgi:hypothetical protein
MIDFRDRFPYIDTSFEDFSRMIRQNLQIPTIQTLPFHSSSMVEHPAVNRRVAGSSPACGASKHLPTIVGIFYGIPNLYTLIGTGREILRWSIHRSPASIRVSQQSCTPPHYSRIKVCLSAINVELKFWKSVKHNRFLSLDIQGKSYILVTENRLVQNRTARMWNMNKSINRLTIMSTSPIITRNSF